MRLLVQRVHRAEVRVDGVTVGRIGPGLVALLGVRGGDTTAAADWLADKLPELRVFEGDGGKFDRSLRDAGGSVLVVSQFTLYGALRKGRRPDFSAAAPADEAEAMYAYFVERLRATGIPVETGTFGAMMDVELVNAGPVTVMLER